MYKEILVPLDGSGFAESALPLALALSKKTKASIHLVTVVEPLPAFAYEQWESAARDWSAEYIENVAERVRAGADAEVTTGVHSGHVVETLMAEVEARSADVVVMATHGRGALSRAWLGSVADGFMRRAEVPVIFVRPEEGEPPPAEAAADLGTILVPLDGSELSESALAHATELGELFGSAYHLTRVVAYPVDIASPYLPTTVQMNQEILTRAKDGAAEYLEAHADRMRRRGLRVTDLRGGGRPGRQRHPAGGRRGRVRPDRDGHARPQGGRPPRSGKRRRQGAARHTRSSSPISRPIMIAVKDIMQKDVVTVTTDTTARYLARLLADEEISGVPVLDGNGNLAGVVSSTDLVRLAAEEAGVRVRPVGVGVGVDPILDPDSDDDEIEAEEDPYGFFLPEDSPYAGARLLEEWPESDFDEMLVRDIMTPVSFSVEPATTVPELCEYLVRGRIHRAVVVEGKELKGIVTSADVLRAVAERKVAV